jgi:hypothetical protein
MVAVVIDLTDVFDVKQALRPASSADILDTMAGIICRFVMQCNQDCIDRQLSDPGRQYLQCVFAVPLECRSIMSAQKRSRIPPEKEQGQKDMQNGECRERATT